MKHRPAALVEHQGTAVPEINPNLPAYNTKPTAGASTLKTPQEHVAKVKTPRTLRKKVNLRERQLVTNKRSGIR